MIFKDQVVLILGGKGNIGSEIASAFEKEGAKVCRHDLSSGKYAADVRDEKQTWRMIENILKEFQKIDVVVNSLSSPIKIGSTEKKKWPDFLDQLSVQLKAAVDINELVIPQMKKQHKGRIINILTSYTIGQPSASLSDYVTAKYALLGLTKALAKEVGKYNITVNAVSPSFIKNGFTKDVPDKLTELIVAQNPLGRLATAKDVAGAVTFLASDQAAYINGENLIVSGGEVMH